MPFPPPNADLIVNFHQRYNFLPTTTPTLFYTFFHLSQGLTRH